MYRERIEHEDGLLNSRTGIFLVPAGLLITALSVATTEPLKTLICAVGFLTACIWWVCVWQSWLVIRSLTKAYLKEVADNPVEVVVKAALIGPGILRPTDLLARVLPAIFFLAWAAAAVVHAQLWYYSG